MVDFEVRSRREAGSKLMSDSGHDFKWLVSIGGPADGNKPCQGFFTFPQSNRLRLEFDDVVNDERGFEMPMKDDIRKLVNFCKRVNGKCLIHCFAGVSRSSASAIVLCTVKDGPGKEMESVGRVISKGIQKDGTNRFWPNDLIIDFADTILERDGELNKALANYQPVLSKYKQNRT